MLTPRSVTSMKFETTLKPYEFTTTDEMIESRKLTAAQIKNLENILIEVMNEKLKLSPLPGDTQFFYQHEYLRGQMDMIQYIISLANVFNNPDNLT